MAGDAAVVSCWWVPSQMPKAGPRHDQTRPDPARTLVPASASAGAGVCACSCAWTRRVLRVTDNGGARRSPLDTQSVSEQPCRDTDKRPALARPTKNL